ncbi:MAG: hypothetical protein A2252_04375 [Elusimicrobia bacterium RIFOXYA2_FULL_39_19]|nr:MAG: hypothetical protein A2252_04375 [Elusimicrobia bacterium RIFOXYA2_FULL_39_19]
MSIPLQLIITNILVIAMSVFVFLLINRLKNQGEALPGAVNEDKNNAENIRKLQSRIDTFEGKVKEMSLKDNVVSYDMVMEIKRDVNTFSDKADELNKKLVKLETAKSPAGLPNEKDFKKEIENANNKTMDFIEENIRDLNKKLEAFSKENKTVQDVPDLEVLINPLKENILNQNKDLKSYVLNQLDEIKFSIKNTEKLQLTYEKQNTVINNLKILLGELQQKYDNNIRKLEKREDADEKTIDFLEGNLQELAKEVEQIKKAIR